LLVGRLFRHARGRLLALTPRTQVDLGPMVPILVHQCESTDTYTRTTALTWLKEFIHLEETKLQPFAAAMLGSVLHCISDAEVSSTAALGRHTSRVPGRSQEEIRVNAEATNALLIRLVESTKEPVDIDPLLEKLIVQVAAAASACA
jgi:hypothetical protein